MEDVVMFKWLKKLFGSDPERDFARSLVTNHEPVKRKVKKKQELKCDPDTKSNNEVQRLYSQNHEMNRRLGTYSLTALEHNRQMQAQRIREKHQQIEPTFYPATKKYVDKEIQLGKAKAIVEKYEKVFEIDLDEINKMWEEEDED